MKIGILGATGRTGLPLVEQAITAGHTATALARSASKLAAFGETLHIVEGDAFDQAAVEQVVWGQDAVIAVLGPVRGSARKDVMETTAHNLVTAMQAQGVTRLLATVGAGVHMPGDPPPPLPARIMGGLLKVMAGDVLADAERYAEIIAHSDLDWTLYRVPRLADGPSKGVLETGMARPGFAPLARVDVAAFLLTELEDESQVRSAPFLSYTG